MEAKRYAEAEREYREAIRLFETLPDSVRTQLDEWNYGGYSIAGTAITPG